MSLCVQPTFEVLAVAVNSGLVAYPTGYTQVWCGAGGAIWRPTPPAGYMAAGDLFTVQDVEPELADMVCLHGELHFSLPCLCDSWFGPVPVLKLLCNLPPNPSLQLARW